MKKILLIVFTGFLAFGSAAFADSGFGGGAPAQQSFHEAEPAVSSSTNKVQQMAQVEAVMKRSAQIQHGTDVKAAQLSGDKSEVATAGPASAALQNKAVSQVSQQLSSFIQTDLQFQQASNQKIVMLSNQIEKLQIKQAALVQMVSILDQAKPMLVGSVRPTARANAFVRFESQYSMYIIMVLLATILLMLVFKKRTKVAAHAVGADDEADTKDEYDFMGSSEAIPAKLDLAHAYIAMEDLTAAKKVLRQVLTSGNAKQKAEANTMMDKISEK